MAVGTSTLRGVLDSEDTRVMVECLQNLGIVTELDWASSKMQVVGTAGKIPSRNADLFVANSGTTIRFLTALLAAGNGSYRLDGISRMRERPIGDLIDALQQLGVDAKSEFYRTNMCKNIYFSNGTEINTLVESLAWKPSLELHFHLDIAFDSNFELGYIIRITLDITF